MRRPSFTFYTIFLVLSIVFGITWKICFIISFSALGAVLIRRFVFERFLQWSPPQKAAILITGTSSGFGRLFVHRFASQGLLVFAGVRKQEDGEQIISKAPPSLQKMIIPILLDISSPEQIRAAVEQIRGRLSKEDCKLFALINNAGLVTNGPLELASLTEFRTVIEVNLTGQVAVTQAFIPLLREYKGPEHSRILFVGSSSGYTPLPFQAIYAASKHGLEAVADAFRVELSPWNIKVILLEPGVFNTAMATKFQAIGSPRASPSVSTRSVGSQTDKKILQDSLYPSFLNWKEGANRVILSAPTGEPVATLAQSLLFAKFPAARAVIGADAMFSACMMYLYPDSLVDFIWRNRLPSRVITFLNSFKKN